MSLLNKLWLHCSVPRNILERSLVSISPSLTPNDNKYYYKNEHMQAWTVPAFGSLENLKFSSSVPVPSLNHYNDVLVRVRATSINPIDIAMLGGYGKSLLSVVRECENLLSTCEVSHSSPFIPGRDFVGNVVAKGSGVRNDLKIGDTVYGVIPAHHQGCHAEMVVASDSLVRHVPDGITLTEAASFLYCGLTAWSALCVTGDLYWATREGKKALIIGGAGGVGSIAVQMLKAWNVEVITTCKSDAVPLLEKLGADVIIDYTAPDAMAKLESSGKYDIILDAAGKVTQYTYIPFLKDWANSKYITLKSPLLSNTDKFGVFVGMIKNATDLVRSNIISGAPKRGSTVRWGYFLPIEAGVDELHSLLTTKKVKPIVNEIFSFKDLPKAFEKVNEGHNRGKVVVTVDNETTQPLKTIP